MTHYVSSTRNTSGDLPKLPAYLMGNIYIGYQLRRDVELSIAGYNIIDGDHQQIPGGADLSHRILGKLKVNF